MTDKVNFGRIAKAAVDGSQVSLGRFSWVFWMGLWLARHGQGVQGIRVGHGRDLEGPESGSNLGRPEGAEAIQVKSGFGKEEVRWEFRNGRGCRGMRGGELEPNGPCAPEPQPRCIPHGDQ